MGPPPRRQANRMRRRQFIGSGGTATIRLASLPSAGALQRAFLVIMLALALSAAWRPAAAAEKVYRLGILSPGAGVVERMQRTTFPELARLGFAEGKNLAIEVRAGPREQLPEMARQLAESRPDAVIAVGGSAIRAMRQTSPTIPNRWRFHRRGPSRRRFCGKPLASWRHHYRDCHASARTRRQAAGVAARDRAK